MIVNCTGGKGETHTVSPSRIPYQITTWQRRYRYHIPSIIKWLPLHTPKKEHMILFTCCNLSISLMWISWLLGKSFWYTLYAVIESKPSGGSRRGAGRPLIFGPNWGPKCQKNFGGETGSPLTKGLNDRPPLPPYLKVWMWHWSPRPPRPTDLPKMYGCPNGCSLFQRECFWEQPWGSCGYQSKIFTKVNFPMKVTFL